MKNGAGVKCEDKNTNEEWIEEALKKRNAHLQKLQLETNIRKISVQAEIDHHENIEKTLSGPWQRLLKEAMVKLGDVVAIMEATFQGNRFKNCWTTPVMKNFMC